MRLDWEQVTTTWFGKMYFSILIFFFFSGGGCERSRPYLHCSGSGYLLFVECPSLYSVSTLLLVCIFMAVYHVIPFATALSNFIDIIIALLLFLFSVVVIWFRMWSNVDLCVVCLLITSTFITHWWFQWTHDNCYNQVKMSKYCFEGYLIYVS